MSISISKSDLDSFFERLEALEADKKALADEMKDSVASFAANYEVTKKAVNRAFKEYKEAKKDKDEYILVDYEADALLQVVFPEFSTGSDQGDED